MQKQHPYSHFNAPKVFRRRLQVRFDSVEPALSVNKSEYDLFASLHLYLVVNDARCIATISGIHSKLPAREPSSRLYSRELVCMGQIVGKCYKICQSLVTKHHVSGTIARLYVKSFTIFQSNIPGY